MSNWDPSREKEMRDLMAKSINSIIMTIYDKGTKPEEIEIDKVITISKKVITTLFPQPQVNVQVSKAPSPDSLDLSL